MKAKKNLAQPSKIKTSGSTFKNPVNQTKKKVWELIKNSVPAGCEFGDATISHQHFNFLVNKKDAKFNDMIKLINFIKYQYYHRPHLLQYLLHHYLYHLQKHQLLFFSFQLHLLLI